MKKFDGKVEIVLLLSYEIKLSQLVSFSANVRKTPRPVSSFRFETRCIEARCIESYKK